MSTSQGFFLAFLLTCVCDGVPGIAIAGVAVVVVIAASFSMSTSQEYIIGIFLMRRD